MSTNTKYERDALARFPVHMVTQGHGHIDANAEKREGYRMCLIEQVYPLKVELQELLDKTN